VLLHYKIDLSLKLGLLFLGPFSRSVQYLLLGITVSQFFAPLFCGIIRKICNVELVSRITPARHKHHNLMNITKKLPIYCPSSGRCMQFLSLLCNLENVQVILKKAANETGNVATKCIHIAIEFICAAFVSFLIPKYHSVFFLLDPIPHYTPIQIHMK